MTDTTDLDPVQTELGLGPAGEHGGAIAPYDEKYPVHEDHDHPGPRQYVLIAMVLVVLTAIEVALSYLDSVNPNLVIVMLGVCAAAKFFLVCAWYMHMKQDSPFFRRVFIVGLFGASIIYGIVMLMFASTVLKS
jgi:caa(3)-type oxidase subunit IV